MRERYCKVCGGWHQLDRWPGNCLPERPQRSDLPGPMVIRDTMDPVQSMQDGKMYDSKRAMRAHYRRAGVIEVGDDPSVLDPKPRPLPPVDEAGINAAVETAFSQMGYGA
jgi:hypothetical protein